MNNETNILPSEGLNSIVEEQKTPVTPQIDEEHQRDNPMRANNPVLTTEDLENGYMPAMETGEHDQPPENYLLTKNALKKLWLKIDQVENQIISEVNNLQLGKQLLGQLTDARGKILSEADQYDEVSGIVSEVEYHLNFIKRVRESSRKTGIPLLIYQILWLVVLIGMIFFVNQLNIIGVGNFYSGFINISILVNSLIWGGFGGIVGALYALWKHIAKDQDFDPQYGFWYITNPILGVALGGFVYLLIQAGFLSLTAGATEGETIQSAAVIYVFAWIAGFKQNVVYDLVRRVLDVFRVEKQDSIENNEINKEDGLEGK